MDREKIIEALSVIKEVCNNNECDGCPLFDVSNDLCTLETHAPIDWYLNNTDVIWRAFK